MINSNLSQVFRPGVRYGRTWVTGTSFHWFLRDKLVVLKTPGLYTGHEPKAASLVRVSVKARARVGVRVAGGVRVMVMVRVRVGAY